MNTYILILSMIVCAICAPPATITYREIVTRPKGSNTFYMLLRVVSAKFQNKTKGSITTYNKESLENHNQESDELFAHEHTIDDDVRMFFINRKYSEPKEISADNFSEVIQNDDMNLPLKVLINGWSSDNTLFYHTLIPAYISSVQLKVNILLVDWTALDREDFYPKSSLITAVVGQKVARLLGTLVKNHVIKFNDIHLIGYSMGAHIAAIVGEKLKTCLEEPRVGRITGLDPVYPCVENSPVVDNCLNESRALFVDAIRTFTTFEFDRPPIGMVDFYLKINSDWRTKTTRSNLLETNEIKTVELFSESIKNINVVLCCTWEDFSMSSCDRNKTIVMGEHVNDNYRGKFYCHLPPKASVKVEIGELSNGSTNSLY